MQDYLQAAFTRAPHLIGKQVKYIDIHREMRSRGLKRAITLLEQAGILQRIYATRASGLPLNASLNEKRFKLLYLDVGLANRMGKIDIKTLLQPGLNTVNRGYLAEQLVGQELLAYLPPDETPALYFWARDKLGSQAEVDFVMQYGSHIIPIEVKAGKTGGLKSLRVFMAEKKLPLGLRVSEKALSLEQDILSVPFYLLSELERILATVIKN
jgi:predicted AAA+ superfamily ATPase